jgi:hypothetical protein
MRARSSVQHREPESTNTNGGIKSIIIIMGIKYIYIHWEKAKSYLNIQYAKGNVVGSHGNVVGIEGEYDGNRVEIQGEYMSLKSNIMKCRQCR